jgi:hypothetical protein
MSNSSRVLRRQLPRTILQYPRRFPAAAPVTSACFWSGMTLTSTGRLGPGQRPKMFSIP